MYQSPRANAIYTHAYTALEVIRFATQLFTAMDEAEPTVEQNEFGQKNRCCIDRAALGLVAGALQEHVTAARLAIPEATFAIIRRHQNGWPANYPGIEATITALAIAVDQLDRALDLLELAEELDEEGESLYTLLLGAFSITQTSHGFLDSIVAAFDDKAAMEAAYAGLAIPSYSQRRHVERVLRAAVACA